MANTILTPTQVTREALRVLHEKCKFIGSINRQYDKQYAKSGAKIGDTLKVRLPNEYVVRTGATLSAQDTSETSVDLQVATQKGVDLNFTSADLTLSLDDFSDRILTPAMSVLAADLEADALSMYKKVYQMVNNDGSAITFKTIMNGRKMLEQALAPGNDRNALLSSEHLVDIVDALKALFHANENIKKQNRDGVMGRTAGLDFMESSQVQDHLTGTCEETTGYLVAGADQTGATLTVDTGSNTFLEGDVITIAGVYRVHPESKATTSDLQQFVVTADSSGSPISSIAISPSIVITGGRQNVSNAPANNAAIVKVGAGADEYLNTSMIYQKDAFAFATADLVMPNGVDFSSREVLDGISMRVVRQYDINNDKFPCRLDVLYGYEAIRPQLACRIHSDG